MSTRCRTKLKPRVEPLEARALMAAPHYDKIVVVMMENRSYEKVVGDTVDAPWINYDLLPTSTLLTNSHGVEHPSQPNYLDIFSGSNQGVTNDTVPSAQFTTPNLGHQLLAVMPTVGFAWYSESLPSVGSTITGNGAYARKHNAAVDWQGSFGNQIPPTANQPFSNFPVDFSTLPKVSFVTPNLADDMHNPTNDDATAIHNGDVWLSNNLQNYVAYTDVAANNALLILTFDEGDFSSTNHITTIFHSSNVEHYQGAPYLDGTNVNHFSILKMIEDNWWLPELGGAATATLPSYTDFLGGTPGAGVARSTAALATPADGPAAVIDPEVFTPTKTRKS